MAGHDIIVIGASAGGIEVLCQMVRRLPPGLPATLFVVCHFSSRERSALPEMLSRSGPLLASHARDQEPFNLGQIYVAPPDFHMLLEPGIIRLSQAPRENRHRPAIDPLLRSAARVYGPRVVAVILSGALFDGVAGLLAVRAAGGLAVVQDPTEAAMNSMPQSASEIAGADYTVKAAQLAPLLVDLTHQTLSGSPPQAPAVEPANPQPRMEATSSRDLESQASDERAGQIATFTCPDCGGILWQADQDPLAFRCYLGHYFAVEGLLQRQTEELEAALWTAVRIFREKEILNRQLAHRERHAGRDYIAERFEESAVQAAEYSNLIQRYLLKSRTPLPQALAEESPGVEGAGKPAGEMRPEGD